MKAIPFQSPVVEIFALLIGLLLLGTFASEAQVKIPAKSGSSLDSTESDPATANLPSASQSRFQKKSNVSRSAPDGPVRLKDPVAPLPKPGAVTAIQRVETPRQNLDPRRMKRLAELRRELSISETAVQAKMSLPADDLFEATAPTTIDDLSEPTLHKVTEYLELVGLKKVTVKPFYVKDGQGEKELSWTRSLALIEWMTDNADLDPGNFKAAGPEPVLEATPKKFSRNLGEADFVNRIELLLE